MSGSNRIGSHRMKQEEVNARSFRASDRKDANNGILLVVDPKILPLQGYFINFDIFS